MTKNKEIQKNLCVPRMIFYGIVLLLSLWGLWNVYYWEIYKGYSACGICAGHRALYIALFALFLSSLKKPGKLLSLATISVVGMEVLLSAFQVFSFLCADGICRRLSVPDKLNFIFVLVTFLTLLFLELKKYRRKNKDCKYTKEGSTEQI